MPRIVSFQHPDCESEQLPEALSNLFEIVPAEKATEALRLLGSGELDGVYIAESKGRCAIDLFRHTLMFEHVADGIALLDRENNIVLANRTISDWFRHGELVGQNFYQALGNPNIIGAELSPLTTAFARRQTCVATMSIDDRYYQLSVSPVIDDQANVSHLVVSLRDSTEETLHRQKLEALHEAGMALADLRPEEIFEMDVEHRIDLLKENILHYSQALLSYENVELRLLDEETGRVEVLLSVGIDSERSRQPLYAEPTNNGVTGFVVSTGNSYLCEDTLSDPLYLDGHIGARSSLTVPLVYHEQVIGSFNVESTEVGAFDESDLSFVELFARDIAQALNTLELLVAQKTNAAQQSVDLIHSAVALPIDEILNDTVKVMEGFIGLNPDLVSRLKKILRNARDIKQVIQRVGEKMAPQTAVPASIQVEKRPQLQKRNVLVIDADETVRTSAHDLLERYGCVVETAHEGSEAILMIMNSDRQYDAIISDIRLPDMNGYELLVKLKQATGQDAPKLILMTGFGYDPGHAIVKARKEGLRAGAVLYKPFRLDQLLSIVEKIVTEDSSKSTQDHQASG